MTERKTMTRQQVMEFLDMGSTRFYFFTKRGYLTPLDPAAYSHLYDAEQVAKVRERFFPKGLTYKEIADTYGLSRNTIKKYLKAAKLHPLGYHYGVKSYVFDPAQVAELAVSLGWQESQRDESSTPDSAAAATSLP